MLMWLYLAWAQLVQDCVEDAAVEVLIWLDRQAVEVEKLLKDAGC